jgi:crossover junction endodeoxyribonuclease RusA
MLSTASGIKSRSIMPMLAPALFDDTRKGIYFIVYAKPQPQGSSRGFHPKGSKHIIITSDNKNLRPYRQQVSLCAVAAMNEMGAERIPRKIPVELRLRFYFQKPESRSKKAQMTVKPDVDKLVRAVGDSLSGICYDDDSQVTDLIVRKRYGVPERTEIEVLEANCE